MSWMEDQNSLQMSPADHSLLLELIIKVKSSVEAEEYFKNLPNTRSQKAACLPLLHSYIKERAVGQAETLMSKMHALGLTVNPHPFNEMMKLYAATGDFEKILLMIEQMKHTCIPRNILSYNLWLTACDVETAEKVFEEMLKDTNVKVGWSTYCTLANIYIKSGFVEKADSALKSAEGKLSTKKRLGYSFLITLYSNLGNKDGILRVWEASKAVKERLTCADYICVLSSLVKNDNITKAEEIFASWENECRNYDIRVSNILLGAYARNRMMDKAELLHLQTLEKGGCPNYKTWEILMEGWVKNKEMGKAVIAMKKGFSMSKRCEWRPESSFVMAIAEYFEERGCVEEMRKYVKVVRQLGLASLGLYKCLMKVYVRAKEPAPDIVNMMEDDGVGVDEEALELIKCLTIKGV